MTGRLSPLTALAAGLAVTGVMTVSADDPVRNAVPTFTKDVLPILQHSCQGCHRPGTGAPMSLLTYEDVRPWARAIKARTTARQMPPWHVDRSIGEYENDPSLSDQQIATIAQWVDGGAPRGNPADAPPARTFSHVDEWFTGEQPDLIVSMEKGFTIPAEGPDMFPSETVDAHVTEDRYIKWIQVLPTAYCCVHHSNVYQVPPDDGRAQGAQPGLVVTATGMADAEGENKLIEYAMGNDGDLFADGTTKILRAGAKIRFSPHYHPWGKEIHDKQRLGIKFYPKGVVPKLILVAHRIRTGMGNEWALNREKLISSALQGGKPIKVSDFDAPAMPGDLLDERAVDNLSQLSIPPNSIVRHERFMTLKRPALVISFQPHMHFRGKRMLLEAIHLDGRREVLTDVPNYEQTWQITYTYKVPHLFPAGTILHTISWHDNTANNKHNPDPSAWVGWGTRTMDEMGNAWTEIGFLTDAQYQEELAKRKAAKKSPTPESR